MAKRHVTDRGEVMQWMGRAARRFRPPSSRRRAVRGDALRAGPTLRAAAIADEITGDAAAPRAIARAMLEAGHAAQELYGLFRSTPSPWPAPFVQPSARVARSRCHWSGCTSLGVTVDSILIVRTRGPSTSSTVQRWLPHVTELPAVGMAPRVVVTKPAAVV
jgi:hypothetical protein